MIITDKIIRNDVAPHDKNVLWLNTKDNQLYIFKNGWVNMIQSNNQPTTLQLLFDIRIDDETGKATYSLEIPENLSAGEMYNAVVLVNGGTEQPCFLYKYINEQRMSDFSDIVVRYVVMTTTFSVQEEGARVATVLFFVSDDGTCVPVLDDYAEVSISNVINDINDIRGDIDNIITDISNINNDMVTNDSLNSLNDRLQEIESRLSGIETQLNSEPSNPE